MRRTKLLLVGVAIGILVVTASYYYFQYRQTQRLINDPVGVAVEQIGKHVILPDDEIPTLATVADPKKLISDSFFAQAQIGDQVLIYRDAKLAILYRPSVSKVIKMVSLNSETIPAAVEVKQITVAVYNGTNIPGLAIKTSDTLTTKYSDLNIIQKSNAKGNYPKTIVVDLTGNLMSRITELVTFLGAEVRSLPEGETKPSADVLVIVGQ